MSGFLRGKMPGRVRMFILLKHNTKATFHSYLLRIVQKFLETPERCAPIHVRSRIARFDIRKLLFSFPGS
jgi:hypothetical protein